MLFFLNTGCNNKTTDADYNIINLALMQSIQNSKTILSKKNTQKNNFLFMIDTSMYGLEGNIYTRGLIYTMLYKEQIRIKDYKNPQIIDINKINLPLNTILINSIRDTLNYKNARYLGKLKFSRVMYNDDDNYAYIIVSTHLYKQDSTILVSKYKKENHVWKADL